MKKSLLIFLVFPSLIYAEAILQANLSAIPTHSQERRAPEQIGKIQPGSPMKVIATVKNTGTEPNNSGKLFLRFMFPEPLKDQPNSLLFETEKLNIPTITPGQEVAIAFNIGQNWPSLFDFIRYDWGVRQYQAVLLMEGQEEVIGTLSIVFSAYYYEGPAKEIPVEVATRKVRPLNRARKHAAISQSARHTPTHHRQLVRHGPHETPGNREG